MFCLKNNEDDKGRMNKDRNEQHMFDHFFNPADRKIHTKCALSF